MVPRARKDAHANECNACEVWLKTRVYCLTFLLGLSECVWQSLHGILQPGTKHGRELEHLLGQAGREDMEE